MQLFLIFAQSNLNFELSFVEIHQVLKEIWPFEHKFQATLNFGGIKCVKKLFIKLLNLIPNATTPIFFVLPIKKKNQLSKAVFSLFLLVQDFSEISELIA